MRPLAPRERLVLAVGGSILAVILLVGGVILPWRAADARLDARIASRRQQLAEFDRLAGSYRQLAAEAAVTEQRLAKSGNFQLVPYLEALVDGVAGRDRLAALRPQPGNPGGPLREEIVELRLERLRLDQLVRLLHAVDSAEACLATRQLRVRQRFDDTALLDVELSVAAYRRLP